MLDQIYEAMTTTIRHQIGQVSKGRVSTGLDPTITRFFNLLYFYHLRILIVLLFLPLFPHPSSHATMFSTPPDFLGIIGNVM